MKARAMELAIGYNKCCVCNVTGSYWEYWKASESSKEPVDVVEVYCSAKCSTEKYNAKIQ